MHIIVEHFSYCIATKLRNRLSTTIIILVGENPQKIASSGYLLPHSSFLFQLRVSADDFNWITHHFTVSYSSFYLIFISPVCGWLTAAILKTIRHLV